MKTSEQLTVKPKHNNGGEPERLLRDGTLADRVYEQILKKIISGEIAVGDKMPTEHVLCADLQVSRPILRQALRQLRADDVIVSRQGSGSYVVRRPDKSILDFAPPSAISDIQRTFEFRAAVEGEGAFLSAQRRTEQDLKRIKAALRDLDRCIKTGALGVEADEEFHVAICEASGNRYFAIARVAMKTSILAGMNLTRNLSLTKPSERLALVQKEHYLIFEAIAAQDPEAARAAMRMHVENARKRVFEGGFTDS